MSKYRVTVSVTVVLNADTVEDAELKVDNAVNLKKIFTDKGMTVIRAASEVLSAGS